MHELAGADDRLVEAFDGAAPRFLFEAISGGFFRFVPGLAEHRIVVSQRVYSGRARADQLQRARHVAGFG